MNTTRTLFASLLFAAAAVVCLGDERSDAEIRAAVVWNLAPRCGGGTDRDRLSRRPSLAESVGMGSDTGRLARILADIAQTNDAWYARVAMRKLEKYGTPAQLPFLYSCVTNSNSWLGDTTPAIGDIAMKAALRIEGVTSNSVAILSQYLLAPKQKQFVDWDRSDVCEYFVSLAKASQLSAEETNRVMNCLLQYAPLNNVCPEKMDGVITSFQASYGISKRRLSVLRAVSNMGVDEFNICYVTNAINELVAYPEANLPD